MKLSLSFTNSEYKKEIARLSFEVFKNKTVSDYRTVHYQSYYNINRIQNSLQIPFFDGDYFLLSLPYMKETLLKSLLSETNIYVHLFKTLYRMH